MWYLLQSTLTSWPSLLWPDPNIRLYSESSELLKSDFSKLWLSKTSRVWRTLPMVNPGERLQKSSQTPTLLTSQRSLCELWTVLWPAVVSWHLSNDHLNSTAWPRSFTCSSISLSFVRTCGEGRGGKTWSWHPQVKINEWENHHNGRIQKSIW